MIRAIALCLALVASPAGAETCYFGANGTSATIKPGNETFAEILLQNKMAVRAVPTCDLELFGVVATVTYDAKPGDTPDTVSISVPPGFVANPESAVIADGESFTFDIELGQSLGF